MARHERQTDEESTTGPQLVERMFSGFGHASERPHRPPREPRSLEAVYRPLEQSKARPGATYRLHPPTATRVHADSPALEVMTDLTRVAAVCTRADATVREAQQAMIAHSVRALFVLGDEGVVQGIITATDVLGEKPVQVAYQRGMRHDEVLVRQVMTPADLLEAMDLEDVRRARVGDIVASLRRSGRQHALVTDSASDAASHVRAVRGIFSVTQIARQLGVAPQPGQHIALTFSEIESAIGA
ncbi:MAG TPA: CBS domain-containing protein [Casimicrobiaceae bacterium]|jgi:CBS domain-containing protein